ncbi:hypothetical protein EDD22DRAFT_848526 [Suillus occidentalis]|nr:hypothetical protein EDD22DRAFT_848526 [Suillus occidentalis]
MPDHSFYLLYSLQPACLPARAYSISLIDTMSDQEDHMFKSDDNDNMATLTFQGAAQQGNQGEPRPFDLANVPSSIEADDALPQSKIFECLFVSQDGGHSMGCTWEQTKVQSVSLSTLARTFKKGDKATAINFLHHCSVLHFDNDFYYDNEDEMLAWDASNHFLDFCLIVGGSISLHTLLSNKVIDHTFSTTLNLCLPTHLFHPKFSKLGFDPTGCMMASSWHMPSPKIQISLSTSCTIIAQMMTSPHGGLRMYQIYNHQQKEEDIEYNNPINNKYLVQNVDIDVDFIMVRT